VTITGGQVTATGGSCAAGIGSGGGPVQVLDGARLTIKVVPVAGYVITGISPAGFVPAAGPAGFYTSPDITSDQTVTVTLAPIAPAPSGVSALTGDGQASVSFASPMAGTTYTVTSAPGDLTATGNASPITVTGLTNGTAYTFTITATTSDGTGPASAPSNAVTPMAIVWPTASAIDYGQALADSALSATASDAYGAFAWTDSTVTPTVANSGYEVTFTPLIRR